MILFIAYAIALISLTAAQVIIPQAASNSFPACALSCTTLLSAQSACVPPAAPVTDEVVYVSCFCQSALLETLHSSPDATCDQSCTIESDRQELMAWYNNLCASGGASSAGKSSTTFVELYPVATTNGAVIYSTQGGGLVTFLIAKSSSNTVAMSTAAASTSSAAAGGLTTGAKAGVGVGVALAVLIAVAVAAWLILSRRQKGGLLEKNSSQRRYDKSELDSGTEVLRMKGRAELPGDILQIETPIPQENMPSAFEEKERVYEI